jgi:hypothetical protein
VYEMRFHTFSHTTAVGAGMPTLGVARAIDGRWAREPPGAVDASQPGVTLHQQRMCTAAQSEETVHAHRCASLTGCENKSDVLGRGRNRCERRVSKVKSPRVTHRASRVTYLICPEAVLPRCAVIVAVLWLTQQRYLDRPIRTRSRCLLYWHASLLAIILVLARWRSHAGRQAATRGLFSFLGLFL